jgi:hypothetical protein
MFQETNGQPGSYLTSGDHFFIPWDIFIQQSEPGRAGATASATRYRGASLEPRACRAGASKGEGMAIAKVATSVRCATRPSRRTSACRPGIRRGRGRRCQHSRVPKGAKHLAQPRSGRLIKKCLRRRTSVITSRRVRDAGMGGLVQQPAALGAHRQHPAGRS